MTVATGKNNTTVPFGFLKNGLIYRDDVSSFLIIAISQPMRDKAGVLYHAAEVNRIHLKDSLQQQDYMYVCSLHKSTVHFIPLLVD